MQAKVVVVVDALVAKAAVAVKLAPKALQAVHAMVHLPHVAAALPKALAVIVKSAVLTARRQTVSTIVAMTDPTTETWIATWIATWTVATTVALVAMNCHVTSTHS